VTKSIGIIGFGKIAQAVILPLIERDFFKPENIVAIVGSEKNVLNLRSKFPKGLRLFCSNDSQSVIAWDAPIKILSVKPQQICEIKEQESKIIEKSGSRAILISLLPGINLAKLQRKFPNHICVRAIVNTPILIGKGLTCFSWGEGIQENHKSLVRNIFEPISELFELPEKNLDSFLALTSSGPAYVAMIAESLSDGAVASGLSRELSDYLSLQTLQSSAQLMKERKLHPGQLKNLITSPAGTTIEGLRHLEMSGLRSALIEAVVAAAERSRNMT